MHCIQWNAEILIVKKKSFRPLLPWGPFHPNPRWVLRGPSRCLAGGPRFILARREPLHSEVRLPRALDDDRFGNPPPPDSAADFGRIAPNSGRIAGFLEFVSKLHGKVYWRRRRWRFSLWGRLKKWYFSVTFLNVFGSHSPL